jgi:hypothetical protein
MKLNLYYAPYPSQVFDGEDEPVNTERPHNPKSALPTLAAGVRAFSAQLGLGCDIEIIDLQLNPRRTYYKSIRYGPRTMRCYRYGTPFEEVEAKIREADVHGITCNFTNSAQIVADLARFIKRVQPGTTVVAGGVDCTARPSYYLQRGVDVVVRGEGEYVFSLVLQALANHRGLDDIPDICTVDRPFGNHVEAGQLDMDALEPMALDLVGDLSIFNDTAEGPPPEGVPGHFVCWETSRGCAWRCSFCTAPSRGRYRYMSAAAIEAHLRHFRQAGIRTIVWQEDNPLSRIQRNGTGQYLYDGGRDEILQMFHLVRDYGFAWEFANGIEFGKFVHNGEFDHELASALLDHTVTDDGWVGCYRIQVPLDNMNIKRKRFPKLLGFDEQVSVLATMLTEHGVAHQTYDLFIGYPEHDQESIDQFGDYCLRIREELTALGGGAFVPYFNVFNLSLLPGARDYTSLRSQLAFDIEQHPELIGIFLSAINTNHFSYWDIYQQRLQMTNRLNDRELHRRYDGIYAG